ncbi:hypothetical protein LTR15_004253 [Elasticomyces elasticus]|nr:hypothetical protein LTR15_004253 [Elasticomyces elasticus]
MPPRKEPKEAVVYPASKRKGPAFKPQRPSQKQKTNEDSQPPTSRPSAAFSKAIRRASLESKDEDEEVAGPSDSSDEDLANNPLATTKAKPTKKAAKPPAPATKRKAAPTLSISSDDEPRHSSPPPAIDEPPAPTQLSDPTQIPQPLLIRLLHEGFASQDTKIDKHALQIVQKYLEIFAREAIARTAMQKKELAEKGEVDAADAGWLELEDLERVAPGSTWTSFDELRLQIRNPHKALYITAQPCIESW